MMTTPSRNESNSIFYKWPLSADREYGVRMFGWVAVLATAFLLINVRPAEAALACYADYIEWDYTSYAHSAICPAGHTWCGGVYDARVDLEAQQLFALDAWVGVNKRTRLSYWNPGPQTLYFECSAGATTMTMNWTAVWSQTTFSVLFSWTGLTTPSCSSPASYLSSGSVLVTPYVSFPMGMGSPPGETFGRGTQNAYEVPCRSNITTCMQGTFRIDSGGNGNPTVTGCPITGLCDMTLVAKFNPWSFQLYYVDVLVGPLRASLASSIDLSYAKISCQPYEDTLIIGNITDFELVFPLADDCFLVGPDLISGATAPMSRVEIVDWTGVGTYEDTPELTPYDTSLAAMGGYVCGAIPVIKTCYVNYIGITEASAPSLCEDSDCAINYDVCVDLNNQVAYQVDGTVGDLDKLRLSEFYGDAPVLSFACSVPNVSMVVMNWTIVYTGGGGGMLTVQNIFRNLVYADCSNPYTYAKQVSTTALVYGSLPLGMGGGVVTTTPFTTTGYSLTNSFAPCPQTKEVCIEGGFVVNGAGVPGVTGCSSSGNCEFYITASWIPATMTLTHLEVLAGPNETPIDVSGARISCPIWNTFFVIGNITKFKMVFDLDGLCAYARNNMLFNAPYTASQVEITDPGVVGVYDANPTTDSSPRDMAVPCAVRTCFVGYALADTVSPVTALCPDTDNCWVIYDIAADFGRQELLLLDGWFGGENRHRLSEYVDLSTGVSGFECYVESATEIELFLYTNWPGGGWYQVAFYYTGLFNPNCDIPETYISSASVTVEIDLHNPPSVTIDLAGAEPMFAPISPSQLIECPSTDPVCIHGFARVTGIGTPSITGCPSSGACTMEVYGSWIPATLELEYVDVLVGPDQVSLASSISLVGARADCQPWETQFQLGNLSTFSIEWELADECRLYRAAMMTDTDPAVNFLINDPGYLGIYSAAPDGTYDTSLAEMNTSCTGSYSVTPTRTPSMTTTGTASGTSTGTPTNTPTPTPSITATPTETPTQTPTPSITATPTETPTASITASPTETPTPSITASPTETPTPSITASPTETPTQTPTASITATPTETPTPSITASPTETPTASVTASPTETPTPSITATPTETPTQTPTASVTASPTETPTGSVTASPTETATGTTTQTPTGSVTASPTETPTASLSAGASASETPSNSGTPSATVTGTPSPTALPTETPSITASITASPSVTQTGTPSITTSGTGTPSTTATVTTTRTTTRTSTVSPSLSGTAPVTPSGTPSVTPTPSVSTAAAAHGGLTNTELIAIISGSTVGVLLMVTAGALITMVMFRAAGPPPPPQPSIPMEPTSPPANTVRRRLVAPSPSSPTETASLISDVTL